MRRETRSGDSRGGGDSDSGGGGGGPSGEEVATARLDVVFDEELDPFDADRRVRQLRSEIARLDVESVSFAPAGPAPPGVKGADAVTVGAILVALSASGGVVTTLIDTLRDWLGRQSARHRVSVTIDDDTIELERASSEERQKLLDAFIRRHTEE